MFGRKKKKKEEEVQRDALGRRKPKLSELPPEEQEKALALLRKMGDDLVESFQKTMGSRLETAKAQLQDNTDTTQQSAAGIATDVSDAASKPQGTWEELQSMLIELENSDAVQSNTDAAEAAPKAAQDTPKQSAPDGMDPLELQRVREHYDKQHLARETALFERSAREETEKLWEDFEQSFPHKTLSPEVEEVKQAVRDRLEEIRKNTVLEFEGICTDGYEKNGRVVDRDLLSILREAGSRLLSEFKEVAKEFLDKAKDVLTEELGI